VGVEVVRKSAQWTGCAHRAFEMGRQLTVWQRTNRVRVGGGFEGGRRRETTRGGGGRGWVVGSRIRNKVLMIGKTREAKNNAEQ